MLPIDRANEGAAGTFFTSQPSRLALARSGGSVTWWVVGVVLVQATDSPRGYADASRAQGDGCRGGSERSCVGVKGEISCLLCLCGCLCLTALCAADAQHDEEKVKSP